MDDQVVTSEDRLHATVPPIVLVRLGEATAGRDRRPLYAVNLRWRSNPRRQLTSRSIEEDAAGYGASWQCTRQKVTAQYALGGEIAYADAVPSRDRLVPSRAASLAGLLCGIAPTGVNLFVYQAQAATPASVLCRWDDMQDAFAEYPVGSVFYSIVLINEGMVDLADSATLAGGGDLLVNAEMAHAYVSNFIESYPEGRIYSDPEFHRPRPIDSDEPLSSLLDRAASKTRASIASVKADLFKQLLVPVLIPGIVVVTTALAVSLVWPAFRSGSITGWFSHTPPPVPYTPPPPAPSFAKPLPSAWLNGCFTALDSLFRPVYGYDITSISCSTSDARTQVPGATAAGIATVLYTPRKGSAKGLLRDITTIFGSKADRAAGVVVVYSESAETVTVTHPIIAVIPGRTKVIRGSHALMKAAPYREWLLDQRQKFCVEMNVEAISGMKGALLSKPGAPLAVTMIGDIRFTVQTAEAPQQFGAWLDGIPGTVLASVSRSLIANSEVRSPGASSAITPDRTATYKDVGTELVGCDHPSFLEAASWKMEVVTNVLP